MSPPPQAAPARVADAHYLVLPGQRFFNTHYHTITAASVLARRALSLALLVFAVVKYRAPIGSLQVLVQEGDPNVPFAERAMLARGVAVLTFLFSVMIWLQSLPPVEGVLLAERGRGRHLPCPQPKAPPINPTPSLFLMPAATNKTTAPLKQEPLTRAKRE